MQLKSTLNTEQAPQATSSPPGTQSGEKPGDASGVGKQNASFEQRGPSGSATGSLKQSKVPLGYTPIGRRPNDSEEHQRGSQPTAAIRHIQDCDSLDRKNATDFFGQKNNSQVVGGTAAGGGTEADGMGAAFASRSNFYSANLRDHQQKPHILNTASSNKNNIKHNGLAKVQQTERRVATADDEIGAGGASTSGGNNQAADQVAISSPCTTSKKQSSLKQRRTDRLSDGQFAPESSGQNRSIKNSQKDRESSSKEYGAGGAGGAQQNNRRGLSHTINNFDSTVAGAAASNSTNNNNNINNRNGGAAGVEQRQFKEDQQQQYHVPLKLRQSVAGGTSLPQSSNSKNGAQIIHPQGVSAGAQKLPKFTSGAPGGKGGVNSHSVMQQKNQEQNIRFGEMSIGNNVVKQQNSAGSSQVVHAATRDNTLPNITSKFEMTQSQSKMFMSPYGSKLQPNNLKHEVVAAGFGTSITFQSASNNPASSSLNNTSTSNPSNIFQRQIPNIQDLMSRQSGANNYHQQQQAVSVPNASVTNSSVIKGIKSSSQTNQTAQSNQSVISETQQYQRFGVSNPTGSLGAASIMNPIVLSNQQLVNGSHQSSNLNGRSDFGSIPLTTQVAAGPQQTEPGAGPKSQLNKFVLPSQQNMTPNSQMQPVIRTRIEDILKEKERKLQMSTKTLNATTDVVKGSLSGKEQQRYAAVGGGDQVHHHQPHQIIPPNSAYTAVNQSVITSNSFNDALILKNSMNKTMGMENSSHEQGVHQGRDLGGNSQQHPGPQRHKGMFVSDSRQTNGRVVGGFGAGGGLEGVKNPNGQGAQSVDSRQTSGLLQGDSLQASSSRHPGLNLQVGGQPMLTEPQLSLDSNNHRQFLLKNALPLGKIHNKNQNGGQPVMNSQFANVANQHILGNMPASVTTSNFVDQQVSTQNNLENYLIGSGMQSKIAPQVGGAWSNNKMRHQQFRMAMNQTQIIPEHHTGNQIFQGGVSGNGRGAAGNGAQRIPAQAMSPKTADPVGQKLNSQDIQKLQTSPYMQLQGPNSSKKGDKFQTLINEKHQNIQGQIQTSGIDGQFGNQIQNNRDFTLDRQMHRNSGINFGGKNPVNSIMLPQLKQEFAYGDETQGMTLGQNLGKVHHRQYTGSNIQNIDARSNANEMQVKQLGHQLQPSNVAAKAVDKNQKTASEVGGAEGQGNQDRTSQVEYADVPNRGTGSQVRASCDSMKGSSQIPVGNGKDCEKNNQTMQQMNAQAFPQTSADDYGVISHGAQALKSQSLLNRGNATDGGGLQNSLRSGGDHSQRVTVGLPNSRGDGVINERLPEEQAALAQAQQQAAAINPADQEKMKQLKQFIHMVDLLNGLEVDQRFQYIEANEYSIGRKTYPQHSQHQPHHVVPGNPLDQRQNLSKQQFQQQQQQRSVERGTLLGEGTNFTNIENSRRQIPSIESGGQVSQMKISQGDKKMPVDQMKLSQGDSHSQALKHDQMQAVILQEQIENLRQCQKIDINIWRHFQSLLKKNLHNPYLREALMKRAATAQAEQSKFGAPGSQMPSHGTSDISIGLRLFLEDLSLQDLTQSFNKNLVTQNQFNHNYQLSNMKMSQPYAKKSASSNQQQPSATMPGIMASSQNTSSNTVSLADKNIKQRMGDSAGAPGPNAGQRQRTHDPISQTKSNQSTFIQVVNGQRDEVVNNSVEKPQQQIMLERYVAAANPSQQQNHNDSADNQNNRLRQSKLSMANQQQPASGPSSQGFPSQNGKNQPQIMQRGPHFNHVGNSAAPNNGPGGFRKTPNMASYAKTSTSVDSQQVPGGLNPHSQNGPGMSTAQLLQGNQLNQQNPKINQFGQQHNNSIVLPSSNIVLADQKATAAQNAQNQQLLLNQNDKNIVGKQHHQNTGTASRIDQNQPEASTTFQAYQNKMKHPSTFSHQYMNSEGQYTGQIGPNQQLQYSAFGPQGLQNQQVSGINGSQESLQASSTVISQQARDMGQRDPGAQDKNQRDGSHGSKLNNQLAPLQNIHGKPYPNFQYSQNNPQMSQTLNQNAMGAAGQGSFTYNQQQTQSNIMQGSAQSFLKSNRLNQVPDSYQTAVQMQQQQQPQHNLPSQISSTLFIMDCQTFGIFNNQRLLKIPGNNPQAKVGDQQSADWQAQQQMMYQQMGMGLGLGAPGFELTEAQVVNFVMSRAQTSTGQGQHGIIPKELPKLSEDAKRILNTIKAQQHLNMFHEIQKIDTLVIELDYYDYKNQLLQQLFHHYGNRVLSNLVHKIVAKDSIFTSTKGPEEAYGVLDFNNSTDKSQAQSQPQQQKVPQQIPEEQYPVNFQTIHEYIDRIRRHHDEAIRLSALQQQQLFSQINDLSSGNDCDHVFESVDVKSNQNVQNSANRIEGREATTNAQAINRKIDQFSLARSSEALAEARKSDGQLEIMGQKQKSSENIEKTELLPQQQDQDTKTNYENNQMQRSSYKMTGASHTWSNVALFQNNLNQKPKRKVGEPKAKFRDEDLQQFAEELQHLFPKYRCRKVKDQTHINLDHSFSSDTKKKQLEAAAKISGGAQNQADGTVAPVAKQKMKKLNFHVIVRDTKLYHALRFIEEYRRDQNSRELSKNDAEGDSKGPMSIYQLSSEMSNNKHGLNDLSSFILTRDCSILKFALYCFHVGIVNSVQQMMRQFFKHVFIVIKPGSKTLPDGTVQKLKELPQVDVDKISKYLIQTKMRKAMQNQQKNALKNGGKLLPDGRILNAQEVHKMGQGNLQNSARRNVYGNNFMYGSGVSAANQYGNGKKNLNQRYESRNHDKGELQKNFSLKSFKSVNDINQSQDCFNQEYYHHFNSGPSQIKVDSAQEPTTIKIIHKPYTHLDNSRIQKAFKIYNEFVQLVFKNRLQIVQNADNFQQSELQKGDINKIYRLAAHMNIKLPKRTNSSVLGRQPLIEMLKNHRQLSLIKEQMVRFIHRVLNEENGISQNFFNAILLGSVFQPNSVGLASNNNQSPQKDQGVAEKNKEGSNPLGPDYQNALSTGGTRLSTLTQNHLILRQMTTFYKYQVGVGNNHQLIKSLMKQRLWWHHIQRDKQYQQGIIRLDFDEAHIMWTQWRKVRLYFHLTQYHNFHEEFKDIIAAIDQGRIHIVLNSTNGQLNQEGLIKIIDKFVKQDKALSIAERSARAAAGQLAINQKDSVSPRLAPSTDPKDGTTRGKYKSKSKSNNRTSTKNQQLANTNDYDFNGPSTTNNGQPLNTANGAQESQRGDTKSPGTLNQGGKNARKLNVQAANSAVSNSEGGAGRKQAASRIEQSRIRKRQKNDSENDADQEEGYSSAEENNKGQKDNKQSADKKTEENQCPVTKMLKMSNADLQNQLERCKRQFQKIYNRLEFNQHLNNKKALFLNMRNYYTYCCDGEYEVFDTLPLTFHIKQGQSDPEYYRFEEYYKQEQFNCQRNKNRKNIWIIKPGENTNRGTGIKVEQEIGRIRNLVHQYCGGQRTMILQKYIDNPLLVQRRKFDIRCFSLVTCVNGVLKAYFYRDGYIRTASKEYSHSAPNLNNKFIHLVNDAVQKYSEDYGKYEPGNKLSYCELQRYLTQTYPDKKIHLERDIIMQIKKIVTDTIRATFHVLDSKKRLNSYELFGYDFMFDDTFKPFLIEVNSNPSLEPSSNLLTKLFSQMLDNTFRIAIDPLFPPTDGFSMKKGATGIEMCPENRYDLIFDERIDGEGLRKKFDQIGKKELEEIQSINDLEGSENEEENEAEPDEGEGGGGGDANHNDGEDGDGGKGQDDGGEGFEQSEEGDEEGDGI